MQQRLAESEAKEAEVRRCRGVERGFWRWRCVQIWVCVKAGVEVRAGR